MMWISCITVCVIALLIASNCDAHSQPKYTRVIDTRLPNPATIRLGATLYTVSKKVQYLNVNSTSGKSCKLRVNPLDENIQGRLQATSLNEGERFLVWGIRKTLGSQRYHTLLVVDPNKCSYSPVSLETESFNKDWPSFPAQIVVQERSRLFRVFYPQGTVCSPCRFDYDGKRLAKDKPLTEHRISEPSSHFWIDSYLRSGGRDKYFYAFNFANGTSTVHLMDVNFNSEVKSHFNHTVDAASIEMGTYQNTAICYKSADKRGVTCERLDLKLQPGISWELPLHKLGYIVKDVSIDVDDVGNTFVGVITKRRLLFFVYDVAGELVADFDFGVVDEKYAHREVKGIAFGDEFCLEAVAYSDAAIKNTRHVVKCVDVSKYVEESARKVR